jgi:hypothetical protein
MEPEGSLPHSQEPATYSYPEPYQSSPCLPIRLLEQWYQPGVRVPPEVGEDILGGM